MKFDLPEKEVKGVITEIRKLTKLKDIIKQTIQVHHWLKQIYEFAVEASKETCVNAKLVQMFKFIGLTDTTGLLNV